MPIPTGNRYEKTELTKMGKGYKDTPCIYCREREATTADHVIARGFLPENKRADLPKVPACLMCNNAKSKLEHALTAIMPFGARHADATNSLAMVEPRLARNRKLHINLAVGLAYSIRSSNGGPWQIEMTIPFDHADIERLGNFIIKGLAHAHWEVALGREHVVRTSFLTELGRQFFDPFFAGAARDKVNQDFGDGVFSYQGVQSLECAELTFWKMSLYGAEVLGDKRTPGEHNSNLYGFSAPKDWPVTHALMQMFGQ